VDFIAINQPSEMNRVVTDGVLLVDKSHHRDSCLVTCDKFIVLDVNEWGVPTRDR
jgi:hypothetical protein